MSVKIKTILDFNKAGLKFMMEISARESFNLNFILKGYAISKSELFKPIEA